MLWKCVSHSHALLGSDTQIINRGGAPRLRQADPKYSLRDIKRWVMHRMCSALQWYWGRAEHMLLVCGRWTGSCTAAHGDFCLRRLLRIDGLYRLFLKHWPVTCGFVCREQTNKTGVNNNELDQATNIKVSSESVWQFWGSSNKNETAGFRCK